MREHITEQIWWHIYILKVDNHNTKNLKWFNMKLCYYVGISTDIGHRMGDYLHRRGGFGWVNLHWPDASKILVYVEYFFGNEFQAMKREKQIKQMNTIGKETLINSKENMLVCYKPCSKIILRRRDGDGDIVLGVR